MAFFAASVNVLLQVLTLGLIVLARHDGAAGMAATAATATTLPPVRLAGRDPVAPRDPGGPWA